MRDNTLAAALLRKGREIVLIPVYSPIRTDEQDVSERRVFYGGINVYLQQKYALFRRMPRFVDRLFDSPALLRRAMKNLGSGSEALLGELTISMLKGEDGSQQKELEKLVDWLAEYRPDVVHLPDVMFVGLARRIRRRLGAAIVSALTGEDIFLDRLSVAHRGLAVELIRERAADVDAFIAVSRYFGEYAATAFGLRREQIHHVPLGVRIEPEAGSEKMSLAPGSGEFTIGYFARICPEKGLHVLCEAFAVLRGDGRPCRLKIGGYLGEADRPYFEAIQRDMRGRGLDDSIEYDGELDRAGKLRFLRALDVFSVPTVYREAKGLYVLEALAQGVPVVQPRHGSFPELIEATGGGVLVEPNDPADLARGLAELMDDSRLRLRMGEEGRRRVREQFSDERMAEEAWRIFEKYAAIAGRGAVAER